MKHWIFILNAILLSVFTGKLSAMSLYDYGLYLKSHAVSSDQRTSLYLDNHCPFQVKGDFKITFQLYVRTNEPDFGSVLHLKTDKGQFIRFSFVSGEEKHLPALVLNEGIVSIDTPIEREKWLDVSISLRLKDDVVEVEYDGKRASAMVPLKGTSNILVLFGQMQQYLADVAPVNLRNIHILQDGKQTRKWKLGKHDENICYDELSSAIARAEHPFWLMDNHIEWKQVYEARIPGRVEVAFNTRDALFYLVKSQEIEVIDANGALQQQIPIQEGYPAMEYIGHLLYDTISNQLVSYHLKQGITSRFSFHDRKWSLQQRNPEEPSHYNHARTFNPADSSYYFFGGYGFYQYKNDLFRWKSGDEKVEHIEYERPFYPRYSAAMGIVGDNLYIFGGRGNKYGKQELSSDYYYGLCVLNLKTRESHLAWKKNIFKEGTIMASSMYFEPSDSSFYAVSMHKGGTLWKISMKDSLHCTQVSKPTLNESIYQDLALDLYYSQTLRKLFLVMDKIQSDHTHNLAIYSINMPLLDEVEIKQTVDGKQYTAGHHVLLLYASLFIVIGTGIFLFIKKRKKGKGENLDVENIEKKEEEFPLEPTPQTKPETAAPSEKQPVEEVSSETVEMPTAPHYYDRSHATISLLGSFNVHDKEGKDITTSFTPRLKHLLILLILYSEKYPQGILATKATEILWPDKEETSARNNRNVNLRKLRILLESIGDVEIVTENNFLRIQWGENVFCDYHEVLSCIRQFKEKETPELFNRILELLLYGPLLPNTILDWLDDFKDAYSSHSIDLLKSLLELEIKRHHQEMVIRLTDIMFRHDPLNEEALTAKCTVLVAEGKKGIARNVYDRFCKEYLESMGEEYKIPFNDL